VKPPTADLEAVLYVLGALDAPERIDMDRRRGRDAGLDRTIETWEARLLPLALASPDVAPPASLWDRIETSLDAGTTAAPDLRVIRFASRDWEPWAPGLEVKILTRDRGGDPASFLMRMQAGAVLSEHLHDRVEECLIIEGDLVHEGQTLGPGDFTVAAAGGTHSEMVTRTGGLLYIRYLSA